MNRLIVLEKEGVRTKFLYDAFGRCLQIAHQEKTQQLIYQKDQEIGSLVDGKIEEFRLIHPEAKLDLTFAIELKGEPFFTIQDFRGNICGLQEQNGDFWQWMRYSAFGAKQTEGNLQGMFNPWRFANRREVGDLSLFTHRFYHPRLMRWITPDPLGFEESLNLYRFDRNNPFCYKDPDGRFAIFVLPVLEFTFGLALGPLVVPTLGAVAAASVVYYSYQLFDHVYHQVDEKEEDEEKDKKEKLKFPENPDDLLPELPRDEKGRIRTADNLRIRPEKHEPKPFEKRNPRHHDQHYHIETRRDPSNLKWKNENVEIIKPPNYYDGMGTGFLTGENFPGS